MRNYEYKSKCQNSNFKSNPKSKAQMCIVILDFDIVLKFACPPVPCDIGSQNCTVNLNCIIYYPVQTDYGRREL
jgi:hypothetical protein